MSEPRFLVYHEWLLVNQWHRIWGILIGFGLFFRSMSPIQTPFMNSLKVYRMPESLVSRVVFELAYQHCS